ncbi:MAG: putative urea ABC transporter substrate-binding protein [Planctomycetota bacterium]|jgi:NitT/TauT family transport system substrate-binding protein
MSFRNSVVALAVVLLLATGCGRSGPESDGAGPAKGKYTLAVSIYAGWMPWYYANEQGIIKKWADKYDIEIEVVYMDYIASVEAFVAEQADACVMTNMECLDMPSASGIDSTVLIVGDYSNGNDAILVRDDLTVAGLKGHEISLVELSVSHYMLVRALEENGLAEADVTLVNTSDSDIGPAFIANESQKAVVTWNPIVMNVLQNPGVTKIFDSSQIPGEILDLCVVNTKVLKSDPHFGEALVGAWYEVMGTMSKPGPEAKAAKAHMAEAAGCSPEEYEAQLKTTAMFWTPDAAIDYIGSAEVKEKMEFVRKFCFAHGLLGESAASVDVVGIEYPDGNIQGDDNNVKMRFSTDYMQKAAEGSLR